MAIRGNILVRMLIFVIFITALIYFTRKATDIQSTEKAVLTTETTGLGKISLDVYYEALCPDSRDFIIRQLGPTFDKLNEIIDLSLVPYGKATSKKTANGYEFDCQHGPAECYANKFHACAVKQLEPKISVPLVVCLMENNRNTKSALEKCAQKVSISHVHIDECAEGDEGNKLLYLFGELTHDLSPSVYFIPTVEIEKSQDRFKAALHDLKNQICQEYQKKYSKKYSQC
eukprot:TRINITY_DN13661_c0_g1_i1.p1 TRINITY_DN13661_c0_g1~~TRINITY_DN13661_c0_g1_i1.p1  ORF type:complete len:230 (-),score=20.46 TRINITY_DN13661_c0_g1_i1:119-808(-)